MYHRNLGGFSLRKSVICWLAFAGLMTSAQAADQSPDSASLPPDAMSTKAVKNPLPNSPTFMGVTFFGSIDLGYIYETNGAPSGLGSNYYMANYNVFGSPAGYKQISALNSMALSYVGVKVDEDLGNGWRAIGQLSTNYVPLSGQLADECKARIQSNGLPNNQRDVNGNGSKCGQLINDDAYAGFSNTTYGKLTVGRQVSIALDIGNQYDPQQFFWAGSGWQWDQPGTPFFDYRWDNSVKYTNNFGPFHAQVMYAGGSQNTGIFGNAYAADIGATWRGFSLDADYTAYRSTITDSTYGVGACGNAGQPSCSTLKSTAQNIDTWQLLGKYTYDLAGGDKYAGLGGKLTFYAGYVYADYTDPSSPVAAGLPTQGGYIMGSVNNTPYAFGGAVYNTLWTGAKYEIGQWTFATGYYIYHQKYFATSLTSTSCSSSASFNCAGNNNTASVSVQYQYNKYLNLYGGLVWSNLTGGLANGYPNTQNTAFLTGAVLRF